MQFSRIVFLNLNNNNMNTSQDSGNNANIVNFQNLIQFCTGFGAGYNPTKDALKIASLQSQLGMAKTLLNECTAMETAYDNAVDARRDLFVPLKPLVTKIVNALSVSGVSDSIIEGAKAINRKVQGKKATTPNTTKEVATDGTDLTQPKTISSSHQSYDYMVEHLNALIELISSHDVYDPNEEALKVSSLKSYLANLRTANINVMSSNTAWTISRANRNKCLYAEKTGLVDTALDVKNYIKSAFGTNSMEYGMVKGLSFKNLK